MLKNMFALLFVLLALQINADGRRYVWTYEYQTMPKGHAEMESYTEFSHIDTDDGRIASTKLQYEYEIGMNDRYDVGIYQVFSQNAGAPLHYDGFKIRMRYRLGEKNQFPIDPLIYLEYKDNAAFDHSALETKLILAKDLGKFNLAINPVLEVEFEEDETEVEWEYTAAFGYRLHPLLTFSMETKGSEDSFYWGPTFSHGKEDLWFAVGLLNKASDKTLSDRLIRLIIGIGL